MSLKFYDKTFLAVVFLAGFLPPAVFSGVLYGRVPHIVDGAVMVFHSKIIQQGKLYSSPPPIESINHRYMTAYNGRYASKYEPGFPALLAVGGFLGFRWLVNPVLAGLTCVVTFLIGRLAYDQRTGLYACLLMSASPFFIIQSGSFFRHTPTMFWLSVFTYLFLKAWIGEDNRALFLSGVFLGLGFLTRAWSSIIFSLPFFCLLIAGGFRGKNGFARALRIIPGFLVVAALILPYNHVITGSPLTLPFTYYDPADRLGFNVPVTGPEDEGYSRHTFWRGLRGVLKNIVSFGVFVGWWPLALALSTVYLLKGKNLWDYFFGIVVLTFFFQTAFYHFQGEALGPRYVFECLFLAFLVFASGIKAFGRQSSNVFILVFLASIVFSANHFIGGAYNYRNYNWVNDSITEVAGGVMAPAIIFVAGNYDVAFSLNEPGFDSPVVYSRYRGPLARMDAVDSYYPGRNCYTYNVNRRGVLNPCSGQDVIYQDGNNSM